MITYERNSHLSNLRTTNSVSCTARVKFVCWMDEILRYTLIHENLSLSCAGCVEWSLNIIFSVIC
jgi:hypothetical protein